MPGEGRNALKRRKMAGSLPLMDATGPLTETLARLYGLKSSVCKKAVFPAFSTNTTQIAQFDVAFGEIGAPPRLHVFLESELFDMQSTNSVVLAHHLELLTCSPYDFKVQNIGR